MFEGTIIENSLADKSILSKLKIEKTYPAEDWVLHDVLVDESQFPEIAKSLSEGPWYAHFWKPGSDDVKVVYRDKLFDIKYSDKSTWAGAISYGKSIGIPEEQLDFLIG